MIVALAIFYLIIIPVALDLDDSVLFIYGIIAGVLMYIDFKIVSMLYRCSCERSRG